MPRARTAIAVERSHRAEALMKLEIGVFYCNITAQGTAKPSMVARPLSFKFP